MLVAALTILMGSCSPYTSSVKPDAPYQQGRAYLYGRFHIEPARGNDSDLVMGFAIRCRDQSEYTFRFNHDDRIQVLELPPGTCQIEDFVYTEANGRVISRRMAEFRLLQNEILSPGGLYYVGDFRARTAEASTTKREIFSSTTTRKMAWRVTSIVDDYALTTTELKRDYPNLAPVATENRMPRRGPSGANGLPADRVTRTYDNKVIPIIIP